MADIATLGLSIDSRPVAAATAELNKLAPAARAAEVAAAALQKTTRGVATAMPAAAKAAETVAKAHAGLSAQAMAAQHSIRSMTESLVLGMPPSMILGQQLNHLAFAASGPGGLKGAFSEAAVALRGLLSPMAIGIGSIAALAGGAYLAANAWKTFALQLDDTAQITGIATSELSKLQAAASFKGISNDEFAKGMGNFAAQVYQAQHGMGSLADWLRVSGERAKNVEGTFAQVADLIQRAESNQQRLAILQAAGLPATMEWVRLLQNGGAGLRQAKSEAAAFGGTINDEMVARARQFDEEWNKTWTNFGIHFRAGVVDVIDFFDKYGWLLRALQAINNPLIAAKMTAEAALNGINPFASSGGTPTQITVNKAPTGKAPVDPNEQRNNLQKEQQRIALLGSLATVQDAIRAKENEINLAAANGVHIRKEQVEALKRLAEFEAEAGKLQQQTQFGIFDSTRQMANAQLQLKTLIDNGTITNAQQYGAAWAVIQKNVQAAAEQAAIARSQFEGLTRYAIDGVNASKQLDQFGVSALSNIENGLVSFANGTKTAGEAFADMTRGIMSDLLRMIIRAQLARLVMSFLPGLGGGIGAGSGVPLSILPAIHHKGYGPGDAIGERRYVHPAYFDDAPRFHGGIGPGERPAVIRDDESVLTPGQMKALGGMIRGNQANESASKNGASVTINQNLTFNNADPGSEARMREFVRASNEKTKNDTIKQFIKLQRDAPGATRPT